MLNFNILIKNGKVTGQSVQKMRIYGSGSK